jgi:soluble lytic murein transglycosylase-like protein
VAAATVCCALLAGATLSAGASSNTRTTTGTNTTVDPQLRARLADVMAAEVDRVDRYDAEVWLMASEQRLGRFIDDHGRRIEILQNVYREASRHDLDADLVLAVIHVESAFDRFAVSSAGAQGLMQVMPFWRLEIGRPQDNLTKVDTNIRYGTTILAHYLDVSRGDLVEALARDNGSKGRLRYPDKVVTAWRRVWRNQTSAEVPGLLAGCKAYPLAGCRFD